MSRSLSKRLRFEIFKRDGFTCTYCGAKAPDAILQVDHIVPVAAGGLDDVWNLTTACRDCNLGKSATPLSDLAISSEGLAVASTVFRVLTGKFRHQMPLDAYEHILDFCLSEVDALPIVEIAIQAVSWCNFEASALRFGGFPEYMWEKDV